jgi:hypothetical protein
MHCLTHTHIQQNIIQTNFQIIIKRITISKVNGEKHQALSKEIST